MYVYLNEYIQNISFFQYMVFIPMGSFPDLIPIPIPNSISLPYPFSHVPECFVNARIIAMIARTVGTGY